MSARSRTAALGVLVAVVLAGAACGYRRPRPAPTTSRDHGVAEHSRQVMPFDVTTATHTFTPTPDGLVETVTENPPPDAGQVALIRSHLAAEAAAFAAG